MKNRNAIASYLMTVPGILAVAAIILYTRVMYTMAPVYFMLGGVIVLVALGFVIARKFPRISNYIPVCVSVLLASAAVWGSELMVNQIGYVVAGLDGVETIISWIVYLTLVIIALIVSLVASFLPIDWKQKAVMASDSCRRTRENRVPPKAPYVWKKYF